MTDLTTLLAGIKERAEKATPGSWEIKEDCRDYPSVWHDQEVAFSIGRCADCGVEAEYEAEDAAFIASARTDVPRLVAALEAGLSRMEERAKMLRETSDRLNQQVMDRDTNRDLENATRYANYSTEADAGFRQLRTAVVAALGGGE